MKKYFFLCFLSIFLFSCTKSSLQEDVLTKKSTTQSGNQLRLSNPAVQYDSVEDFLDWFDALYDRGDFAVITNGNPGVIVTSFGNDPTPDPAAKHDIESSNKLKFAKWYKDHLDAGDCLKAGKNGDTYWADVVPC